MDSVDLTADQIEKLFATLDRQRRFLERLYDRTTEMGFPQEDPLRRGTARALQEVRALVLTVNDSRRKGLCRGFQRRAKSWKTL